MNFTELQQNPKLKRNLILAVILHAITLFWLFQLNINKEEWKQLEAGMEEKSTGAYIEAIRKEYGLFGFLRFFYSVHRETKLYFRYAKLTLYGDVDYWVKRKGQTVTAKRPLPYRDILVEYPPGSILFFIPAALISDNKDEYRFWVGAWFSFLYLLNLFMGLHLLTGGRPTFRQMNRLLWWSLAFLHLFGAVVVARFDHAVVTCILASALVYRSACRHEGTRQNLRLLLFGIVVSMGVLTKIIPGLIAPAVLLILVLQYQNTFPWQRMLSVIAGLGMGLVVLNLIFYSMFGQGYIDSFTYHMKRGVQIETLYSGLILLAHLVGFPVTVERSYGSHNVVSSMTEPVKMISPWLFIALSAYLAWIVWSQRRNFKYTENTSHVLHGLLLLTSILVLMFMLTNKVFSPQYFIWIAPLILIQVAVRKDFHRIGMLFLVATLLTQILFPHLYDFLKDFHPVMIVLLNIRNGLMVYILFLLLKNLPQLLNKVEPHA